LEGFERRERIAQRDAVGDLLAESGERSLLRMTSGEVVIYNEEDDKLRPVSVRAVVMPDGRTEEFGTARFRRSE
jgi:hypothetical protein